MIWHGRTAVVTGVARPCGIGQACAKLLFKHGYNIIGVDLHTPQFADDVPWSGVEPAASQAPATQPQPAGHAATAPPARPSPQQCAWLQVDLSKPDQVLALPALLQQLGVSSVHVLVNNAGIADPYMPSGSLSERAALWAQTIAVNLSAPFLLSEALLPLMGGRGASITHVSSTRALQSEPHCEGYGSAKAGLVGLTHAQAASLAPRGVRVNAVLPGWIDTSGEQPGASSITQEQHEWHWTGRVGVPADVAELVLFLTDPAKSGFISGQQFVVDGGVTKRMTYPE